MLDIKCLKCGRCCQNRFESFLDLSNPKNQVAVEAIKKQFREGKVKIALKEYKKVGFVIEGMCENFDEETKLCKIYPERPDICKKFYCDEAKKRCQ